MANATFLYAGTTEGLVIGSRPGMSKEWHVVRRALEGQEVQVLARGESFPVRLLAATPGGLVRSPDGGRNWQEVLDGPILALAADSGDRERVFALTGSTTPRLFRSTDGGETWTEGEAMPQSVAAPLLLLVTSSGEGGSATLWIASASGVMHSGDDGASWQSGAILPGISALEAAPGTDHGVYVAAGDGIYHLSPAGSVAQTSGAGPTQVRQLLLIGMTDKPEATALLAATEAGELWHSEDGAATWRQLRGDEAAGLETSAVIVALAAHPEYPDRAYLATEIGALFETANRGRRWARLDAEAGAPVKSLMAAVLK